MTNMQETISPIDSRVYVTRALASESEIKVILEKSHITQKDWANTPLEKRQEICLKAIDWFEANVQSVAQEITWQMGRPIRFAQGEIAGLAERGRYMVEASNQALRPISITEKVGFTRYIKREPLGVVAVIAPWNYPYLTAVNSIIPALLAGNSVILKHSAQTPLCAERFAEAFTSAGLPEGVFQVLHMTHEDTTKLIQSDQIQYVGFTGSVAAGAHVEQSVAGRFIGMGLELGGKDPAYIRADADLDAAVETVIDGAYFNSGQSCCGIERIYVHESVHDAFVDKAITLINQYKLGRSDDPETTLGPLVRTSSADFVRGQIQEAIEQGAMAHIQESDFPLSQVGTPYLAPQLLTQVNHSMRIMYEESFGPVVGVMKVRSDEEAVALMNDSEFGLTASIFTRDIETGIALGEQIQTGTFFINRCDYLDPALAWTGIKQSGRGCTLSVLGFDALTRPKSFHIKQG